MKLLEAQVRVRGGLADDPVGKPRTYVVPRLQRIGAFDAASAFSASPVCPRIASARARAASASIRFTVTSASVMFSRAVLLAKSA